MDDVLCFNHLQALGTHNSYHVETIPIPPWHYTRLPLDQQLETEGVRQFELDLHYSAREDRFEVYHVVIFDQGTTCRVFTDCLQSLKGWSDAHPGHHPLFVLLETKDFSAPISAADYVADLEAELLSVWPEERLITPDFVKGDHRDLAEAIETEGWPTLGQLRGKILFVLHDTEELRDEYTYHGESLDGRLMFVESSIGQPFAATLIMNDPIEQFEEIQSAVSAGYLVRTRADSDGDEARNNDTTMRDAALESGAQFVSTDFPEPTGRSDYYVQMPGGTPSRCNPRTAPTGCTSEAIEDPALLAGP
jgi:hypothetical protein